MTDNLAADAGLPPDERRAHFAADLPPDYYAQLTAETFNPIRNRYELRRGRTGAGRPSASVRTQVDGRTNRIRHRRLEWTAMSAAKEFLLELAQLIERHGEVVFYYTRDDDGVHISMGQDADDCFIGYWLTPAALRDAVARQDQDQDAPGGRPHGR